MINNSFPIVLDDKNISKILRINIYKINNEKLFEDILKGNVILKIKSINGELYVIDYEYQYKKDDDNIKNDNNLISSTHYSKDIKIKNIDDNNITLTQTKIETYSTYKKIMFSLYTKKYSNIVLYFTTTDKDIIEDDNEKLLLEKQKDIIQNIDYNIRKKINKIIIKYIKDNDLPIKEDKLILDFYNFIDSFNLYDDIRKNKNKLELYIHELLKDFILN